MAPARLPVVRQLQEARLPTSVRMDLAAPPNPIDSILSSRHSLRLSATQAARLRGVAVADAQMLQALEQAGSVLTAYQWARLSDGLGTAESRSPASPVASVQEAAQQDAAPARPAPNAQGASQQQTAPTPRTWAVYTGLSNVYDTNLDHSQPGLEAYGVLVGLGGWYPHRSSRTPVAAPDHRGVRQYTGTTNLELPRPRGRPSVKPRLGPHWAGGAAPGTL